MAIAGSDVARAQECIAHALSTINGAELPLAAWRINVTAAELFDRTGDRGSAANHRELRRAVVLELANSLPVDEPLRHAFLSAGAVKNLFAFGESGRTQEGSVCDKV